MIQIKNIIICITGTMTSGKAALKYFLVDRGFKAIRHSQLLVQEGKKLGYDMTNKNNSSKVSVLLRKKYGLDILSKTSATEIRNQERYVICPIRYSRDLKFFKDRYNALIIFTDAPFEIRYRRTKLKNIEEKLTIKEFKKIDNFEQDPTGKDKKYLPDINSCRKLSDEIIINNKSLDYMNQKLEKILRKYRIPDLEDTDTYEDFDV